MGHLKRKAKQQRINSKKQEIPGIYRNERDKSCFKQYLAYRYFKYLLRRTLSGKIMLYKKLKIASDSKYDRYQSEISSKVYKFFDK